MSPSKYLIGIDLGTTNCTMAYTSVDEASIAQFLIPQVMPGETEGENHSLPSFIFFPLDESRELIGFFAREKGGELPGRVIASAKSWLCHGGIDRRQNLLPYLADEETKKMSPVQACAELLKHLKESWNSKMDPDLFESQQIFITVPASFDPSARQLVIEAAENAGYPEIVLLEEPQAAFYAWLQAHENEWRKMLQVGDTILVVDIGGGTTDFSLISVEQEEGNLFLKRLAVGDHLLLGGDNMDLSLAYLAKNKLEESGHLIDEWQLQTLIPLCRDAKERLMAHKAPKSVDVTVMGRGTKLIGGTLKTTITQAETKALLVDGFIPIVGPMERSLSEKRSGMQQLGLPYAQDARISSQLAKFLSMTGESDERTMNHFVLPTAVLFNGGALKAHALRERLLTVLNGWAKELRKPEIKELPDADLDFAVSRGAACYGLARLGKAIRIKSGTSRSYYIGVEDAVPAVPGIAKPLKAYCVVPFGMEEGTERELPNKEFALLVGEHATFRFFSHATATLSNGEEAAMGTLIRNWKKELTELHPLETHLDKGSSDDKVVRVKLRSKVTELGVLELWCVSDDGRQWKLEFNIRQDEMSLVL